MKKTKVLLIALFLPLFCFAAEYRVIQDTKLYDGDGVYKGIIDKNKIVRLGSLFTYSNEVFTPHKVDFQWGVEILDHELRERLIDIDAIIPAETKDLFEDSMIWHKMQENGKFWASKVELDILKSNTRYSYYKIHKLYIDYMETKFPELDEDPWYVLTFMNQSTIINNLYINLNDGLKYRYHYLIKKIKRTSDGYIVSCELSKETIRYEYYHYKNDAFEKLKGQAEVELKLVVDGDYLYFYSDNDELLTTYMKVDQTAAEQYENLMLTGSCDLTKVNWPRRADGSSDYEGAESPIGSDIMTVKENLRLRSGESTTTQVLAVMQAGSKVKILNIGDDTRIDGVHGFWMKVEVQEGAKDRDGKPIHEGTVGWCFGGYLE